MSGLRDSDGDPPKERSKVGAAPLPIMDVVPKEFRAPNLDFLNPLAGKKENQETYPPIVTIDGRVDTDIDHLIDEEEDYTGPVVDIPSRFPKPHIFSVVDGSLDDDIDNYLNDDGTIEHTLVDAPKNFNPSELKDVASKDAAHKNLDLSQRSPNDAPLTNRSYNKTHTEQSETEVTNEAVEGQLSINVGSHEFGPDDQSSEELVGAGEKQDLVPVVTYEKMNFDLSQIDTGDRESSGVDTHNARGKMEEQKKEAIRGGLSLNVMQDNIAESKDLAPPTITVKSEEIEKEIQNLTSPVDKFITTDVEIFHTVMYCHDDTSGRGDSILSTMLTSNKGMDLVDGGNAQQKIVDPLSDIQKSLEVPNQQGREFEPPLYEQGFEIGPEMFPIKAKKDGSFEVLIERNDDLNTASKINPVGANDSIPSQEGAMIGPKPDESLEVGTMNGPQDAPGDSHTLERSPMSKDVSRSDSDLDVHESLALLSKLEEFKGDKEKTKELLNQFKQLMIESSLTKLDRASKSESMQSSLMETPQRSRKNSEHLLSSSTQICLEDKCLPGKENAENVKTASSKNIENVTTEIPNLNQPRDKPEESHCTDLQDHVTLPKTTMSNDVHRDTCVFESYERTKQDFVVEDRPPKLSSFNGVDFHEGKRKCQSIDLEGQLPLGIQSTYVNETVSRNKDKNEYVLNDPSMQKVRRSRASHVTHEEDKCNDKSNKDKNKEKSSSKKIKHYTHGKKTETLRQASAECLENLPDQKSAHKCPSSVGLNKESRRNSSASPTLDRLPGVIVGSPPPTGRNEWNSSKKRRERTESIDSKLRWLTQENKERQLSEKWEEIRHMRKENEQSIKESLKVALKVAEESVSAAAKVARALSFVMEATKPRLNLDTSTDEEGVHRTYNRLMNTVSSLETSKQILRSQSVSPSKRVDKTHICVREVGHIQGLFSELENVLRKEKHTSKDHAKKERGVKDSDRKSSSIQALAACDCTVSELGKTISTSPRNHLKEKKEMENGAVVKVKNAEGKHRSEESRARYIDIKVDVMSSPVDGKLEAIRLEDGKHRSGEERHGKSKPSEGKHRTGSEGRRKHEDARNRHEDKRHKSDKGRRESSADGRSKAAETKQKNEVLRDNKKDKVFTIPEGHYIDSTGNLKACSIHSPPANEKKQSGHPHSRKNVHQTNTMNNEPKDERNITDLDHRVGQRTHHDKEELQQKDLRSTLQLPEAGVLQQKENEEAVPQEWRIPLTKHNVNRKSESFFEQVTIPKPIGDSRAASKILIRRLLQGSRVDAIESEASETDSIEYDSNFNRVLCDTCESKAKRQNKSLGKEGNTWQTFEEDFDPTRGDKSNRAWEDNCFCKFSQASTRAELHTAFSYKASHISNKSRTSQDSWDQYKSQSPHKVVTHHHHPGKQGPEHPSEGTISCLNAEKCEPTTVATHNSPLASSVDTDTSETISGPKLSLLKQNIMMHQLPFPERRRSAEQRFLRDGLIFSPILEEATEGQGYESLETDSVSSLESNLWWKPSKEPNTNNGNVYDFGSDVDVPKAASSDQEVMQSGSTAVSQEDGIVLLSTSLVDDPGTSGNEVTESAGDPKESALEDPPQQEKSIKQDDTNNEGLSSATLEIAEDRFNTIDATTVPTPAQFNSHDVVTEDGTNETTRQGDTKEKSRLDSYYLEGTQENDVTKALGNQVEDHHQNLIVLRSQVQESQPVRYKGSQERQSSPGKTVVDFADQYKLKTKHEARLSKDRGQQMCDQKLCSRLVEISKGPALLDTWLRKSKSASVEMSLFNRLREQEAISRQNFEIARRLLSRETSYSREDQLEDYQKNFFRLNRRYPDDLLKKSDARDLQSVRANFLAQEQARAIDEFYSKGASNNRLQRSFSLPPIRKWSLQTERLKSPYSRDLMEKDYKDHCLKLAALSKHPQEKSDWLPSSVHSAIAKRLEEREKRLRLATQKIDLMCKNREPPYAPRYRSKS
ncbi:hypothetical protein Bpfe_028574 [Biomphalaria pfeifferi]|uniref:Uncharacterized protein n=1 Tax=Biomphalaria pfeifferi TaxID=112525 RepID=A0AAD8AT94_BIOPF|nr:hypothetical protein Bpfe_028574 [Biomphalaria pfeifferi]